MTLEELKAEVERQHEQRAVVVIVDAMRSLARLQCKKENREMMQLIARGMNTWDKAPKWLHELYDELQGNDKLIHKP